MDCKECKKLIAKFLDEQLDPKQQELMEKHLSSCPNCVRGLESLDKMVALMRNLS
ncbi:MAG: zf-HC2 domain-containing protein [PVC group bacterium]|nr:zf-HC2 domain-containing protein [PVC group bacterium]